MQKLTRSVALLMVFVIGLWQPAALSWGEDGHLWINRVAAQKMPKTMPLFFRQAVDRLSYLGPEPDRWRNQNAEPQLKYSQEADHFFDSEALPADFGPLPGDRYKYIKQLYEARQKLLAAGVPEKKADELLPERIGFQPYITMEVLGRLRVAFRDYRHLKKEGKPTSLVEGNIITYAGWLGHYVADGSQPLHVTVHHHGWVGDNPHGYTTDGRFHAWIDGGFIARAHIDFAGLAPQARAAAPVGSGGGPDALFRAVMNYLVAQNGRVVPLYELEKAGKLRADGSPGSFDGKGFIEEQLLRGGQMLGSLWLTAWRTAPSDHYLLEQLARRNAAAPAPAGK